LNILYRWGGKKPAAGATQAFFLPIDTKYSKNIKKINYALGPPLHSSGGRNNFCTLRNCYTF